MTGFFCNLQSNIKSESVSILYQNVWSLLKNVDQPHALLTKLNTDFDFIGIIESYILKTNFSPIKIARENSIEQTPTESNAGWALLYRKHSFKVRKDLRLYEPYKIESISLEVIMPKKN